MVALAQRRYTAAADRFAEELAISQELGERRRAGLALLNLGSVANAVGSPAEAVDHLTRAGTIFAELGEVDAYNAARCRIALGRAHAGLGQSEAGVEELNDALSRMRHLGSLRGQAEARHALGELALRTGRTAEATAQLRLALDIYDQLGDGEAAEVRRLLELIPPAQADPDRIAQP
jgi:tetratricopeptide (TPR) repeat protein